LLPIWAGNVPFGKSGKRISELTEGGKKGLERGDLKRASYMTDPGKVSHSDGEVNKGKILKNLGGN